MTRSKYAALNASMGIIFQLINGIVNVILRRVILQTIGINYLGVNGLFSNILQLLGLVESGFGVAIVYLLYKPIADNDEIQISRYLNYFRKIYSTIAMLVLVIGMLFIPVLKIIIPNNPFSYKITIVYYLLFLLNTVSSYFLAYKQSFLNACQQQYYVSIISIISCLMFTVLKCVALVFCNNYIIYLILIIANTCFINILVSVSVDKKFKYLRQYKKEKLQKELKNKIKGDVKALFLHKIGGYVLNGTDNLVITYFVGLAADGIYTNYALVISMLNIFINQLFNAVVPAFGSIIVEDQVNNSNRIYDIFKTAYFVSFLLYGSCALILFSLFQPFVVLWTGGEEYTLRIEIVYLIIINFYLGGMRAVPNAVKSAAGIYRQDKFSPICEAIINLIVSIALAYRYGIIGVIAGTIISGLCMPFWTAPYYVYRDLFKMPFKNFLRRVVYYLVYLVIGFCLVYGIQHVVIFQGTILSFIYLMTITIIVIAGYMGVIFMKSKEKEMIMLYVNRFKS